MTITQETEDTMRIEHASRYFRRDRHQSIELKGERSNELAWLTAPEPRPKSRLRTLAEWAYDAFFWSLPEQNPTDEPAPLWMLLALTSMVSVGVTVAVIFLVVL